MLLIVHNQKIIIQNIHMLRFGPISVHVDDKMQKMTVYENRS
jgi:hypothetical protein